MKDLASSVVGGVRWSRVRLRIVPASEDLEDSVGWYFSDESETSYPIALEDDTLVVHHRPRDDQNPQHFPVGRADLYHDRGKRARE